MGPRQTIEKIKSESMFVIYVLSKNNDFNFGGFTNKY
jgi:hypothetical protein